MQTLIQVICTRGPSLRDAISKDPRIDKFGLVVSETRRMDRPEGWTKIHASDDDVHGAVNVQWVPSSTTLLCRIITRGSNPGPITGRLVGYLISRFRRRIQAIHVIPAH